MDSHAMQDPRTTHRRTRVAIIGTGLAGLTTAYLLHNDKDGRFEVTLFDQASYLSFDSASVAVKNEKTGATERIDLPMRASAGGYYANLMRMYDYLGIPLHPVRFLFVFAKAFSSSSSTVSTDSVGASPGSYFVHASNLHQLPPPKPVGRGIVLHIIEILYLIICHFWFSAACFLIQPDTTSRNLGSKGGETLAEYLQRIWLPRRYISHYLLPLMSSVSTCSHAEILAFPASDIINYKKLSHGQQHYVVCGGIHQVQSRLAEGISDVRLGARVLQVGQEGDEVLVQWQSATDYKGGHVKQQSFDRVVLAVSPDVVARIFSPLRPILSKMPTLQVESSVLDPNPGHHTIILDHDLPKGGCSHHYGHSSPAQAITFRTAFSETGSRTEALHVTPSGVIVQTCPIEPDADLKKKLQTVRFTRTLRTTQSRAVVQGIMRSKEVNTKKISGESDERGAEWVNGQGNVWLTGAWCWDGMVLLEGCVESAMRIADDFGVDIPWRDTKHGVAATL